MGTIFSFFQEKMLFTEIYCHSIEFSFFSEKYVYRASLPPGRFLIRNDVLHVKLYYSHLQFPNCLMPNVTKL